MLAGWCSITYIMPVHLRESFKCLQVITAVVQCSINWITKGNIIPYMGITIITAAHREDGHRPIAALLKPHVTLVAVMVIARGRPKRDTWLLKWRRHVAVTWPPFRFCSLCWLYVCCGTCEGSARRLVTRIFIWNI